MENKKPPVRESWLNLVDALTDRKQIASELPIVKRTQIDVDGLMAPLDATRQLEKWLEVLPGSMRIGGVRRDGVCRFQRCCDVLRRRV